MDEKAQKMLMEEARRIAAGAQGRQLLSLLGQGQPEKVRQAMALYRSGNMQQAKGLMDEILSSAEARQLLEQMKNEYGS